MIEIPERMKRFPLWRGFPVFFTVSKKPDGTPNFKILDRNKQVEAAHKNWCHLCGKPLVDSEKSLYYFIGGPTCMKEREFYDGPMHKECAYYAAVACPFLMNPNAHYSDMTGKVGPAHDYQVKNVAGEMRPARMCIAGTKTYTSVTHKQYPLFRAGPWEVMDWDAIPAREEPQHEVPRVPPCPVRPNST